MQYTVKRSCGHLETFRLYGPSKERESRLQWLRTQPCRECRRREQYEAARAQTAELPALFGSPKQIAWATKIRATQLLAIEEELAKMEAMAERTPDAATQASNACILAQVKSAIVQIKAQSDARWWIDHRADSARTLLLAMIR